MTPGELVSAAGLAALLFGPISRLADLAGVFQQSAASLHRLGDILDRGPTTPEPAAPARLGPVRGRVEFDRVGFGYAAGHPVLRDVRLTAEPGTTVALVGPSGCGKSTLLSLLLRFYDPTAGQIRVDGVPIADVPADQLRRQIGVVPQDGVVFRGTLADNIRYGCPDASDARVEAAARAALVHEFARRLPAGYRTVIGEGGHRLSQGERQRVAIARALCPNPPIVVLDEATSALDPAGEAQVQAALRNLLRGRTAFVVAHRVASVRDADRIVVLEEGRVVQSGTHDELLADRGGLYRRLFERPAG
jgi:ABC-type multidrug transport system fused ATPase/permease subunit